MNLQLDAYLQRIGYTGPLAADAATLTALHRRHLRAIPYENLDVQLRREVTLDLGAVYRKIVLQRRGGWCYEMNGLFAWALREIGFDLTELAAGAMREERGDEAFGNHLALLVRLDRPWLADVGFGDGLLEPAPLAQSEIVQGPLQFGLDRIGGGIWRFLNHPEGGARSFDFTLEAADGDLLRQKCHWLQTAPDSPFVLNAVCQIHTEEGLMMLRGRSLKSVTHVGVNYRTLADVADYRNTLANVFGLDMPEADQLWARILERDEQRLPGVAPEMAGRTHDSN